MTVTGIFPSAFDTKKIMLLKFLNKKAKKQKQF